MPKKDVNPVMARQVWKAVDDGKNPLEVEELGIAKKRTAQRLLTVKNGFQQGLTDSQLSMKMVGGWSRETIGQLRLAWKESSADTQSTPEIIGNREGNEAIGSGATTAAGMSQRQIDSNLVDEGEHHAVLLPPVLLAEVERLRRSLRYDPRTPLQTYDTLQRKFHQTLREYTGHRDLPVLLDAHDTALRESNWVHEDVTHRVKAKLAELSLSLPPGVEIHPWDETITDTLTTRLRLSGPGQNIRTEYRQYRPDPEDGLDGGQSVPTWGEFDLTKLPIEFEDRKVARNLHLSLRNFAEGFLPILKATIDHLHVAADQLIEELEQIIVSQVVADRDQWPSGST